MPLLYRIPGVLRKLYPSAVWSIPQQSKVVYLTFDDGPVPEATLPILTILDEFHAKATFFVVGANVIRHPDVVHKIIQSGHTIANHTFSHSNGWRTPTADYLQDVAACREVLAGLNQYTTLFRPPYGKITKAQALAVQKEFRIVLWDVLSWDYALTTLPEKASRRMMMATRPGSIVLFHDNVKSFAKTKVMLRQYLQQMQSAGYTFHSLPLLSV